MKILGASVLPGGACSWPLYTVMSITCFRARVDSLLGLHPRQSAGFMTHVHIPIDSPSHPSSEPTPIKQMHRMPAVGKCNRKPNMQRVRTKVAPIVDVDFVKRRALECHLEL